MKLSLYKSKHILLLSVLLHIAGNLAGQHYQLSGTVTDADDNLPLIGTNILLIRTDDTSKKQGTVSDMDGHFTLSAIPEGSYTLRISYISFETYTRNLAINSNMTLGNISLKTAARLLENVTVTTQQIRVEQSGDTTSFNANAYKTNPDATADDLIRKMPGMTREDGTVKAGGEEVKRVLVDGKPFFGDDPNATLSNLPAEIIDKIQVFDQLSEQAQLTGFDDGQGHKTINIITKPGKNNGQFGKIYAGTGVSNRQFTNGLYSAGGNVNFFNGDRRVSLIGLSNNINQQNFSSEDLMGVMSSSGNEQGRGRRGGRSGGDAGNFLVGQQQGITQTHSAGINYSDVWHQKIKVSGSYFFNSTENTNANNLNRQYFTGDVADLSYTENSHTVTRNTNHRANLRMEYTIDSANTLIFTPRLSFQQHNFTRHLNGGGSLSGMLADSRTENRNQTQQNAINLSGNLLYRHKFRKKGRTISLDLGSRYNDRRGSGSLYSLNELAQDTTLLDQLYDLQNDGITYSGSLNYTEPIKGKGQLMISYAPTFNSNRSDKATNNNDGHGDYILPDTLLSNKYNNTYTTHRGNMDYRYNDQKYSFSFGAGYQHAVLNGTQVFPYPFDLQRSFLNVLPQAMFNYRFSRTENIRLMYRTNTNAPSISQLQHIVDNSNPLLLRTGNPDLKQHYQHTLIIRYGRTNSDKATSFNAFLYGNYTADYIGSQTIIPLQDTPVINGMQILPGVQLSRPVNLDGYYNIRSFFTYGVPVRKIKSNLNLSTGVQYSRRPGMINDRINYAGNYSLNGGVVVSSNISENTDFTVSWSGNYNIVRNTIQQQSDNNYYSQTSSLQFNQLLADRRIVFNTSLHHTLYSGLSQGFDQQFLLWNAALGYKFLKDRSLDVRLSAFDLLNQNRAISRSVTENYIEDNYTNVLQRYVMLQVTYTLRKFGSGNSQSASRETPAMPPPPVGGSGMHRPDRGRD